MSAVPRDYEESARIDGATNIQLLLRVMVPLAKPGIATITMLSAMGFWNEYPLALVLLTEDAKKTLPIGMANLFEVQKYATDWGALFAGLVIGMIPSSLVKGVVSDVNGHFRFTGVARGKYVAKVSYVGYETTTVAISVGDATVDLGKIAVKENSIVLRDAEVTAVRAEVKVMEDTVEYNADSYKTQPNAVVEDLLKRLPGVEVGSDGKITAQGKEVTKILVDGKEFFSDDAKVASRNIPVDMVDKLQVIDRKSDLARITGVDDGEDETVINLTVKKGMKQGWFGNATVGYGTDNRYSGNLMVNRFVNDNQFSIVADANNINEMSFSMPGSGRFRRFGGVDGVNDAQNVGFNFNVGNDEIFRAGGDVMYSHSRQ